MSQESASNNQVVLRKQLIMVEVINVSLWFRDGRRRGTRQLCCAFTQ